MIEVHRSVVYLKDTLNILLEISKKYNENTPITEYDYNHYNLVPKIALNLNTNKHH